MKSDYSHKKGLGVFLFVIGLILILYSTVFTITGNVVGFSDKGIKIGSSALGLAFIIAGAVLFMAKKEGNLARIVLESGAVITNTKKLKKIAKKMGYESRNVREGYQVLGYNEKPLTVIPKHKDVSKYVSNSILRALSTGESSFRRRAYGT